MSQNQFRIVVGSYEHNLLCLSLNLSLPSPLFTPIFHFQAHSLSVKCLDISKRYLVSGSNDEHIRIYDLQKRKELGTLLSHQGSITSLKFSRGAAIPNQDGDDSEKPVTHGNSKWLLSASEDHNLVVWRVKDWENFGTLKGHSARINDFDIHPSNRIAISVSEDHSIRLWNLMTVKKAGILKLKKYNQNGQFVRWCGDNGEFFAVALLNKVLIYKTSTAKVHREIDVGRSTIMHLEVEKINDKQYIVVALGNGSVSMYQGEQLFKDDADEAEEAEKTGDAEETPITPEYTLQGHATRVKDFKFYRNEFGHYLVTISSDGKIVVWDMSNREQVAVYDCGERLNCLAICDESVERYEMMKKRVAEEADLGEQSEVEEDTEDLKSIMLGTNKKKSKKSRSKKNKKVKVQLE
ncbi:Mak11p [Lachancea thermotolerans CBS 6340]|uniref:KLTH0C00616p n=1 Tax=Lachancea thermotolerans (strain ATCC 56472 / CBS 6340 / NRRL Y-8284) TaxID=559295 RepID=C5DDF6_LACTC|nr:KLTH0C00616p [Lachancea thermotolerans CBS 6340]CAR21817.1 KLTH0C00616p [Lachancea thermotolerans CBS 6340]